LVTWPTLYLLGIGTWHARFVRHLLPLVPFSCLFVAGLFFDLYSLMKRSSVGRALVVALACVVVGSALLWCAAFTAISAAEDTRLAATRWMFAHVPDGSTVILEDKNQPLPVPASGSAANARYKYAVLGVTAP